MAQRNALLLFAMLLAGVCPSSALGQTVATVAAPGQQQVFLAPLDDQALFISEAVTTARNFRADIGFDYLQPWFSSRSTSLRVTAPAGGSVLGGTDNFSNDFAFIPSLNIEYQFDDLGFGVAASGKLMNLTGKLTRNVATDSGNANLIINSSLDIAVANLLEAVVPFDLADTRCFGHTFLGDMAFVGTIGSRYAHVRQHYDAALTVVGGAATNSGALVANQLYNGFGLTSSLTALYPLTERIALYSNTRASILIGNDQRDSTIIVGAANTTAEENRTLFMPSGEIEIGIAYGMPLPHRGERPSVAPLLWIKAGFIGQVWGDIGLLHVNDKMGNQFDDSHLVLYGFTVQVGLDY